MGQQQILIIVLGIILVSVAIALGMSLFTAGHDSTTRDLIVNDLTIIASSAQRHYIKPVSMGGGGNSFNNFFIPESVLRNAAAEYNYETEEARMIITGTSLTNDELIVTLTISFSEVGWLYNWDWVHEGW